MDNPDAFNTDAFAPLTEVELADAARHVPQDLEADAPKPTCPPSDAENGVFAAGRLCGRKPDSSWRYETTDGETAFYVVRWNEGDGRKVIRPLSWFDGEGWKFGAWPNNRPLYNLPAIAEQPNAPIIICEGEKAADAASLIFPKSIATTSSGGAGAAAKTDWTPLAGRLVLIWPDADAAGEKYAREVAAKLKMFDCSVSIIDANGLASIDPVGGARDPEKGWDAADAIGEWKDAGALRKAAVGLAKSFDAGPAFVCHGQFEMRADGLWCKIPIKSKKDQQDEAGEIWLSGSFEIPGRARDAQGAQWARMLRFKDADGREHTATVSDAELHGEATALAAKLAHCGLQIATGRGSREKFVAYLNGAMVRARVTTVDRTGWCDVSGVAVFVLPAGAIGAPRGEAVMLQGGATAAYGSKGTLEGWHETIGEKVATHSRAVLAVSVAFAGPLLHLTGQDGFGVNLFGSSSRGKTTLLQAGGSVWGPPSFVKAWRSTPNALEASAALANDTLLCLDEIGTVEAREAGAAVYAVSNGAGKGRAARDGGLREPKSWRVLTLSSGEMPMAAKIAEGGKRAMAGQSVRMIDIQADAGRGFGCFDHGVGDGDAGSISNAIKGAARENYGMVGPEFVRQVVQYGVDRVADDCRVAVATFVEANVKPGSDGQVSRVAARWALVGVAGELATSFGLTGWKAGAAMSAARSVLVEWIEARGGVEPSETATAISTVRKFIEAHGDARFEVVAGADRVVPNRAGYRKGAGADQEWWCLPEVWKTDICAGLDPVGVAKALEGSGMLRRQGAKLQCNVRVGARVIRAYVVSASILEGLGGDDE